MISVVSAVALVGAASAERVDAIEPGVPAAPCLRAGPPVFEPERIPLTPVGAERSFSGYIELVFASSPFGVTVSQNGHEG